MKKIIAAAAVILCIYPAKMCSAVSTSAESSVVIEAKTGQVLYSDNAGKRLGMASTTKIMTAVLALEKCNLDDPVTISQNAQNQEGSSIYLRAGDVVPMRDLVYGLMLNSGNDAAAAIAEYVGDGIDDFVDMMNQKAKELGCRNTRFENPSGLSDENHFSTAYDMALIMSYAMNNEEFRKIASTREYQIHLPGSVTYLKNHNRLLWRSKECIGGKTGFTKASGRCLVSCARKDDITIIAVTLNDKDDWNDHENLYKYAFGKVHNKNIISRFDILCTKKIHSSRVNILAGEDFVIPVTDGIHKSISCKIFLDENISPAIYTGDKIGYAEIYFGKRRVGTIKIISGENAEEAAENQFFEKFRFVLKSLLYE